MLLAFLLFFAENLKFKVKLLSITVYTIPSGLYTVFTRKLSGYLRKNKKRQTEKLSKYTVFFFLKENYLDERQQQKHLQSMTTSIHWTELPGNKYLKKPEPAMLLPKGRYEKQEIRPVGRKRHEERQWLEVCYDRDYVFARVWLDVVEALNLPSLERVLELILDVWAYRFRDSTEVQASVQRYRYLLGLEVDA